MPKRLQGLSRAAWPDADQERWRACQSAGRLSRYNSATIRQLERTYGRWLETLRTRGALDVAARPSDRASDVNVTAYVATLRQKGRAMRTIGSRLWDLRTMLRTLEPGLEISWVHLPEWSAEFNRGRGRQPRPQPQDPVATWPHIDRALWRAGMAPHDPLEVPSYGACLADGTKRMIAGLYSTWLSWLRTQNRLDPLAHPAERVTRDHARAWVHAMHARGNGAKTIGLKISSLQAALRILQPDKDLSWLRVSAGVLPGRAAKRRRAVRFVDSDVLFAWGQDMMTAAPQQPSRARQAVMYRNGLLIAILAARAPRRRSLAALSVAEHVVRDDAGFRLTFQAADMKTRRRLEYDLPPSLTPFVERYLNEFRPILAGKAGHDAMWLTVHGAPLSIGRISGLIFELSKHRFGFSFGPHRFRHALASTAPTRDPAHPGVASAILGIDRKTLQDHYNVAGQTEAAAAYLAGLQSDRQRTQGLARRVFRQRRQELGP